MKYWQVVKELEENPGKVFEGWLDEKEGWKVRMRVIRGISRYFHFEVFNGESVIDQSLGGGAFNGNVRLDLDWQEVKQPVTWQEAIQAWKSGKNIYVMNGEDKFEHPAYPNMLDSLTIGWGELQWGTWYVED